MSGTRTAKAVAATAAVAALALRELRAANTSPGATPNCAAGPLAEVSRQLSQVSSALNNAVQSLASLPSQIESQVNAAINSALSTAIGPVRTQANAIANELNQLLQVLNDPARFLAQWINMQTLFPNLDLRSLVNRLLSGLGVCAASNSPPPSTGTATAGPPPAQQSTPPNPATSPNFAVSAQTVIREPLPPIPGINVEPGIEEIRRINSLAIENNRLEIARSFSIEADEIARLTAEIDRNQREITTLQSGGSITP
jgi:hypothetical protein